MPDLLPLHTTIGNYHLSELIGQGGMGQVYRAQRMDTGEVVALKALSPLAHSSPSGVDRFRNEAIIQYNLRHPSIARLYEYLEVPGRPPCMVMEYVDGVTLEDRIRENGPIPPMEALDYFRSVTTAIAYIHSCGVIHRDLKSTNVKITSSGQVKILDFGIAHEEHISGLTRVGYVIGTLENLAPEQAVGGKGDVRSDIWALGILLYQMLTGRLPFESAEPDQLTAKIMQGSFVPAGQLAPVPVPGSITRIVDRCLKKKAADRYQNTAELLDAIDAARTGRSISGTLIAAVLQSRTKRRSWWIAAACALVAVIAFLSIQPLAPGPPVTRQQAPGSPVPAAAASSVPDPVRANRAQAAAPSPTAAPEPGPDPYLISTPPRQPEVPAVQPTPAPVQPPAAQPAPVPKSDAPKAPVSPPRTPTGKPVVIKVDVAEGPAALYVNGVQLPGKTPVSFQANDGQELNLRFSLPGYPDLTKKILAGERPPQETYSFHMAK